jgi:hypothetical protein
MHVNQKMETNAHLYIYEITEIKNSKKSACVQIINYTIGYIYLTGACGFHTTCIEYRIL